MTQATTMTRPFDRARRDALWLFVAPDTIFDPSRREDGALVVMAAPPPGAGG